MQIKEIHTTIVRVVGPCVWIKIISDEGVVGLGECYPAAPASAIIQTIENMKEHLIGQDPRNINRLHEKIRRFNVFTGAQGGTVITALSGIEMALWDLLGKTLGVPVYQLFGGKFRDEIRLYADGHAGTIDAEGHHVEDEKLSPDVREKTIRDEMREGADDALNRGFTALKFDIDDIHHPSKRDYWNWSLSPKEIDDIVGRVATLREHLGDDIDLAIDIHGRFDVPSAVQVASELESFRLMWLEEPVPPDVPNGLVDVRRQSKIPICAGENVYTRFGLFDLMQRGAVDVVMPDIAKFGGLMDGIRVAGFAEMHGLPFSPHNVSSPIGTLAMAHVCAAVPNFLILEFHGMDLEYWGDLVHYAGGEVIQNGIIPLSDAPGLGIELNDDLVREHLHERMVTDYFGEPV